MREIERRIERLEQAKGDQVTVTVDWSEEPGPPGEGVIVVSFEDSNVSWADI